MSRALLSAGVALLVAGVSALGHALALPWTASAALSAAAAGVFVHLTSRSVRTAVPQADAGREQLLQAVVETAPMAVLVFGETGRIAFSNEEARRLSSEGRPLDGENFLKLLDQAPETLRQGL